jgi:hypothetical protein
MPTPYFDPSLFSYDDKLISPWERPKLQSEFPLRFWSRATGEKKFQLDPFDGKGRGKRFAGVGWHPQDPMAVSVLFAPGSAVVVNFHVR